MKIFPLLLLCFYSFSCNPTDEREPNPTQKPEPTQEPEESENPQEPEESENPQEPEPGNPQEPEEPENPQEPEEPENPQEPEEPENPQEPEPGNPQEPEPGNPQEPEPGNPQEPEEPALEPNSARFILDGETLELEDTFFFTSPLGLPEWTIVAQRGDCPITADCDSLSITIPLDAQPGLYRCNPSQNPQDPRPPLNPHVSVQWSEGSTNYHTLDTYSCSFRIEVIDGTNVSITNLRAHVEQYPDPTRSKRISEGFLRAMVQK